MPVMQGSSLPKEKLEELFMGVQRILDQDHWQTRGRAVCTCGQTARFGCNDCTVPNLCQDCMVEAHRALPFHTVREWNERVNYYISTTLRDLGLRIGFGHGRGTCPHPRPERLEAITPTGIKTVLVDFCTCDGAYSDEDQIKAHGWWPMRSNFVSAMPLWVVNLLLLPAEADAGGHIIGGPPSTIVQRTSPRNGASTTRTAIRTAHEAVTTNASVLDAATRQRTAQQPTHDENGQRMSMRERLHRARHTTPQASGGRGAGTRAVPIEVLSSPSSPEVEVVSWTRHVVQSTARSTTRTRHSVARVGARVCLVPPLSAETLYLTAARPPDHAVSEPHHMCQPVW
ncbi:hypothetical protein DFH08DRAFT_949529 [Mycena albidolilacea]|uniref:CxC2-like cysteine cluster KDZ transposase-associated domain-containing protein n=1 Tax=Mycena albidolilacea TaxID=1033008 RepID=A0AAD7AN58_9AGAR|nr:hypothetical protein DFH08DRAFT_949529 [Mycena albidolilacea]